jgi:hypothetical protein
MFFTEITKNTGMTFKRPGHTGTGVDAAQMQNIRGPGVMPRTIVIDGCWHECEVIPVEAMLRNAGITDAADAMDERELREEHEAIAKWRDTVKDIMSRVPPDHWISIVDCHN